MNERIDCRDLIKSYPHFHLGPIAFKLPAGYIMGMIGPNGAGKTTTLKLLLDMVAADAGTLCVDAATTVSARRRVRDRIGVSLDSTVFPDAWTAKQISRNMAMFFSQWDAARFAALLTQFDVNQQTRYKKLSKGMQNKVNLAVAMSHHADLLILDEPAAGLDPIARDELLALLQDYIADGDASVLMTSHITEDLEQVADYLLYLVAGTQVFFGETQELLARYVLVQGGLADLTAAIEADGIGLKRSAVGFSVMLPTAQAATLGAGLACEPVSLAVLMRYFGKRSGGHA